MHIVLRKGKMSRFLWTNVLVVGILLLPPDTSEVLGAGNALSNELQADYAIRHAPPTEEASLLGAASGI